MCTPRLTDEQVAQTDAVGNGAVFGKFFVQIHGGLGKTGWFFVVEETRAPAGEVGGQKITFLFRRTRGKWRVEDLWIHQKKGHWSFRDVLGL
jgi:hypothetical protein